MSPIALRTSSSLNGLMMAVTSFMRHLSGFGLQVKHPTCQPRRVEPNQRLITGAPLTTGQRVHRKSATTPLSLPFFDASAQGQLEAYRTILPARLVVRNEKDPFRLNPGIREKRLL